MIDSIIPLSSTELSDELQEIIREFGIVDVMSAIAWLDRYQQQSCSVLTSEQIEEIIDILFPFRIENDKHMSQTTPMMGAMTWDRENEIYPENSEGESTDVSGKHKLTDITQTIEKLDLFGEKK